MKLKKLSLLFSILLVIHCKAFANEAEDSCGGPTALLNIVNRPTVADSACVVPNKKLLFEMGYQYFKLNGEGYAHVLPIGQIRLGLPLHTEFTILVPNYVHQTVYPYNGTTSTTIGLKHIVAYTKKCVATIEGLVTPSSGSHAFGSKHTGAALNGMFNYTINEDFSVLAMLGASVQSQPAFYGGKRYFSINPDVVFTWDIKERLNIAFEVYGQTKSDAGRGLGFDMDVAVIYLLRKNVSLDAIMGRKLIGQLGPEAYIGIGMAILI